VHRGNDVLPPAGARFTERDKIVKFAGCYHGHADSLLVNAGSGALTHGKPDSAGVPRAVASETIVLRSTISKQSAPPFAKTRTRSPNYSRTDSSKRRLFFPREDFLHQLREECTSNGVLLIFDEVMTGFRVARGGAQQLYGVGPDLTALGKVIAAVCRRAFAAARKLWIASRQLDGLPGGNAFWKSAGYGGRLAQLRNLIGSMAGNYWKISVQNWRAVG